MISSTKLFEPDNFEDVLNRILEELGTWRSFLLVIDGRAGLGKSTLSRLISYRLEMPCYGLDEFKTGCNLLEHKQSLPEVIKCRLAKKRPILVEGLLAKKVLAQYGLKVDFLIRLECPNFVGPREFHYECERYEQDFPPDLVVQACHSDFDDGWLET